MILLLNAAVMPTEGQYTLKQISRSEFCTMLKDADAAANFRSYIGYPETARLIKGLTNVEIAVSREQADLEIGDVMLIVKLQKRVTELASKATLEPTLEDFEFYRCEWHPLTEAEALG